MRFYVLGNDNESDLYEDRKNDFAISDIVESNDKSNKIERQEEEEDDSCKIQVKTSENQNCKLFFLYYT
jgi:hypothetical protein